MMIACACDCPGYPGQSVQSDAMLEDSMTSVETLYDWEVGMFNLPGVRVSLKCTHRRFLPL